MKSIKYTVLVFLTMIFSGCVERLDYHESEKINDHRSDDQKPSEKEIFLMKKKILIDSSGILFEVEHFLKSDLRSWEIHHSEWWVEDGWLFGKNAGNHPGMIILKMDFPGNVMVEFEACTIAPSTHDINVMWNGEWIDSLDQRGIAYVAGLEGWWTGKVGIEKSPDFEFMLGTPLLDFLPGKIYKIQAGSINGHCFILADGKLLLEGMDPDPIDHKKFTRIGLEAYSSFIKVKNLKIRQIYWEPIEMSYEPEF